jgi:hypothetical protein
MTYRQHIQDLIRKSWELYDIAGYLRDAAINEEKESFNAYRGAAYNAVQSLIKLDNSLPDDRAQMSL